MKKIELLAPAGSFESLYAAVQSGADAVYLGGSKFSARAYASNFDEENMIKAIDYCHLYDVKVYITINTLLKQSEMKEAIEYAGFLYKAGADALIIQDMGLASLIRDNFPDLELHASTQMTIHNGEGAQLLKELGFTRIVLSRELSVEEIRHISSDLGIETEIFIHGALCICYSGQCLMSSMLGGRSGNRGRCAQPCRLPYTLIDRNYGRENSAYLLSPKDICTLSDIKSIIETQTSSLKIEGRMKRPEYVAGVVDVYRRAIDSVYSGQSFNAPEENKKLLKLFNREGFSRAYLFGNTGKDMMAYNYPKNTGILLGTASKNYMVEIKEKVAVGDGIRVQEEGYTVTKLIKNGKEVSEAFSGEKIVIIPSKYNEGSVIYKTSEVMLLKELEASFNNIYHRKITLPLTVEFILGKPLLLTTKYKDTEFTAVGEIVQKAVKSPLSRQRLEENLIKSGDTPFRFENVDFKGFEDGFLPVSLINAARRELIYKIEKYIIDMSKREATQKIKYDNTLNNNKSIDQLFVSISNREQLKAFYDSKLDAALVVDIFKRQNPLTLKDLQNIATDKLYLKVPNIVKQEFKHISKTIEQLLPIIKGIVTGNLGVIRHFKDKTRIIGDYKLNIYNSYALKSYEAYFDGVSISAELNRGEIKELVKFKKFPLQIKLYGKEELMVSEYCPMGSAFGGKSEINNCNEDCSMGNYVLRDRKKEEFIVRTDKFCRSYIYNSVPTNLIPNFQELKDFGASSFRVDFIDETYEETLKILKAVEEGKWQYEYENYTRGHYKRGVE